jgi:hypothetical protein
MSFEPNECGSRVEKKHLKRRAVSLPARLFW